MPDTNNAPCLQNKHVQGRIKLAPAGNGILGSHHWLIAWGAGIGSMCPDPEPSKLNPMDTLLQSYG